MQPTFILSCESTIDLPYSYVQERELPVLFYSYSVDGEAHVDDMGRDPQSLPRFYQYIADGKLPSTSQLNEAQYEDFFRAIENEYGDRARALITYDRDLSRRIYAAADIFLMPSKSEPCGLSQMIASRYGAIPVVRETGGLYDSIHGFYEDGEGNMHGNGFTFAGYTPGELYERTAAAVSLWRDTAKRKKFIEKIMSVDFSWRASAAEYASMYASMDAPLE